ncbi:MAG: hypothetical protein RI575_16015 [Balneolaceae bacterium]|nr:hypothetical protein [Balneolaceae bacterium]MDR9410523.1 hypothetical protein [Balneolaceae bacterium]
MHRELLKVVSDRATVRVHRNSKSGGDEGQPVNNETIRTPQLFKDHGNAP